MKTRKSQPKWGYNRGPQLKKTINTKGVLKSLRQNNQKKSNGTVEKGKNDETAVEQKKGDKKGSSGGPPWSQASRGELSYWTSGGKKEVLTGPEKRGEEVPRKSRETSFPKVDKKEAAAA